jgi:hypothetical protein
MAGGQRSGFPRKEVNANTVNVATLFSGFFLRSVIRNLIRWTPRRTGSALYLLRTARAETRPTATLPRNEFGRMDRTMCIKTVTNRVETTSSRAPE